MICLSSLSSSLSSVDTCPEHMNNCTKLIFCGSMHLYMRMMPINYLSFLASIVHLAAIFVFSYYHLYYKDGYRYKAEIWWAYALRYAAYVHKFLWLYSYYFLFSSHICINLLSPLLSVDGYSYKAHVLWKYASMYVVDAF